MWDIYIEQLKFVERKCEAQILAFTLMHNHFHLIVKTPNENIDKIMYWIMKNSTLKVQKKAKTINSVYGSRYKSTILDSEPYILNTYKYVLRNPIKAKLVYKVEAYPFSISQFNNSTPVKLYQEIAIANTNSSELLKWININFSELEDKSMSVALSRSKFKYMKNDNTKRLVVPSTPIRILDRFEVLKE